MWVPSLVSWRLRCDAVFRDASPDLHEFVSRWALVLLWWATSEETSLYRQEAVHVFQELQKFLNGRSNAGGTVAPQGTIVPQKQRKLPKWIRWASLLPNMQRVIDEKLANGCDICYTDGSKLDIGGGGVAHAGFGLWYGPEDKRNKRLPVLLTEKLTIDRAELYGVLTAVENKMPSTTTCRD